MERSTAVVIEQYAVTTQWLTRLRWAVVAVQLAMIALAPELLGAPVDARAMLVLAALLALSNLVLAARARRGERGDDVPTVIVLDIALLTGQLALSGGAANPFSVTYLIYVALAAVVLSERMTWIIVALSSGAFATLFALPNAMHHHASNAHLRGMWLAFTVSGAAIASFASRLQQALRRNEAELAEAQRGVARATRLAELTALAAGTAHELSTPLATIAVAAKELSRTLEAAALDPSIVADASLIRDEVERCRAIIAHMNARTVGPLGEAPQAIDTQEIARRLHAHMGERRCERVLVTDRARATFSAPPQGFVQVLANIVKNALDASSAAVHIDVDVSADHVSLIVRDDGCGMSKDVFARCGEPFFTTKSAGSGMGLGVFLSRAFVERLGGSLMMQSELGRGTTVRLSLPRQAQRRTTTDAPARAAEVPA